MHTRSSRHKRTLLQGSLVSTNSPLSTNNILRYVTVIKAGPLCFVLKSTGILLAWRYSANAPRMLLTFLFRRYDDVAISQCLSAFHASDPISSRLITAETS